MKKNIFKLLILAVLSHEIAAVHNGTVMPIYRIDDAQVLKIRKQLLAHGKRAQTLLPMVTIAGVGALAFYCFNSLEKSKKDEERENDRKAIMNNDILNGRQKNVLVPLVLRELAIKEKEKEWEQLPWYSRVWKNVQTYGFSFTLSGYLIYKVQNNIPKLLELAESYATSNLNPNPSFDWYKSTRTKFDQSVKDLARYIDLYIIPEKILDLQQKIKELNSILSEELPDVEPENSEAEQSLARRKMQLSLLQAQRNQFADELKALDAANRHGISELELCQRISTEASYLMQEIEKIIGFLAFADRKIVYSNIEPREKLPLRISNGHIMRSLKAFADNLARTIEQEVMQGRNRATLACAKEVGDIIKQVEEELNSFSKIELRIDQEKL